MPVRHARIAQRLIVGKGPRESEEKLPCVFRKIARV